MRNGNWKTKTLKYMLIVRSYPTYEEWKQVCVVDFFRLYYSFLSYLWGMETSILILFKICYKLFLSYLWGMETPILLFYFLSFYIVLILPMRNGNSWITSDLAIGGALSSYPTYEEWKLNKQNVLMSLKKRSYPTYEEWKRFLFFFYLFPQICSYPTYEEWKLYVPEGFGTADCSSYPTYEEWKP